jgi:hypothetical protein
MADSLSTHVLDTHQGITIGQVQKTEYNGQMAAAPHSHDLNKYDCAMEDTQ